MKNTFTFVFILFAVIEVLGQDQKVALKDLAAPNSPAFVLTDVTPTLVQSPNSPKKFILGLAQAYGNSITGFPDNYSAEFTPYWFYNTEGRNVYSAVGLKTASDGAGKLQVSENIFSGLKFTNLSIAFINKDLVPDDLDNSHKVFAVGLRSTIIKAQQQNYAKKINNLIDNWHSEAQTDLAIIQAKLGGTATAADLARVRMEYLESVNNSPKTLKLAQEIAELTQQKPLFSWDIAGAYANYGIGEEKWQTGRTGVWTTLSTYIPFTSSKGTVLKNFLNLNGSMRLLRDNFTKDDKGEIGRRNNFDIGGKVAFELNDLSIGVETLYRYTNGKSETENRRVGVINYKIADNIYLIGAYGKNFESQSRSIGMFGINWGIGSEKVDLPNL